MPGNLSTKEARRIESHPGQAALLLGTYGGQLWLAGTFDRYGIIPDDEQGSVTGQFGFTNMVQDLLPTSWLAERAVLQLTVLPYSHPDKVSVTGHLDHSGRFNRDRRSRIIDFELTSAARPLFNDQEVQVERYNYQDLAYEVAESMASLQEKLRAEDT